MKWLIVVIFLLISVIGFTYEPLSSEEAKIWIDFVSEEELVDFVIKYDFVEHVVPEFPFPKYAAVMVEQDILLIPSKKKMSLKIGHLEYELIFLDLEFNDIIPEPERPVWWTIPVSVVSGIGIGMLIAVVFGR